MNRRDLQSLSRERLRDAKLLLSKGRHIGAYYLAGYAVECALKACIAKHTRRFDFPDKRTVGDSHTHDLVKLAHLAGLKQDLEMSTSPDKALGLNWTVVSGWVVEDRYNLDISVTEAKDLYNAICTRKSGMMTWLRKHW